MPGIVDNLSRVKLLSALRKKKGVSCASIYKQYVEVDDKFIEQNCQY